MRYEVGKYYRVPCVEAQFVKFFIIPILGSWHEDKEYIGFAAHHYHVDPRFVNDKFIEFKGDMARVRATAITDPIGPVVLRLRKCRREMPAFPLSHVSVSGKTVRTFPALHEAFAGSCLGPHKQCPHKGFSLESLEPVNGVLMCPLHGLCWDAETGRNVNPESLPSSFWSDHA